MGWTFQVFTNIIVAKVIHKSHYPHIYTKVDLKYAFPLTLFCSFKCFTLFCNDFMESLASVCSGSALLSPIL